MSNVDITIPSTAITDGPKPYTIYTVSLRQPLRSHTIQKRYSEFTALHDAMISQCDHVPPPVQLPPRNIFRSTVNNPVLTEERRAGLEHYLQSINASNDGRWRQSKAWTTFLNLPSEKRTEGKDSSSAAVRNSALQAPITDPSVWLDVHRDLRSHVRDARLSIGRRNQAQTAKEQYEANAHAKACLVGASSLISSLERGLQVMGGNVKSEPGNRQQDAKKEVDHTKILADGEIRRRLDQLSVVKKERDNLENTLSSFGTKEVAASSLEPAAATNLERDSLVNYADSATSNKIQSSNRRALGGPIPETAQTRELDNAGVLKLQQQIMNEQDEDVVDLTKAVRRMKEMGMAINEETVLQNKMLGILDEDTERHQRKTDVAKKKINEIR